MRMGKKAAGFSAGLLVAVMAAACGGGDSAQEAAENPASDPGLAPAVSEAPPADSAVVPAAPGAATPGAAPAPGSGQNNAAALVAQGQTAYASSVCVSCHGAQGQGTPLAPAFTDAEWLWVQPGPNMVSEVAALIKQGVPTPKDPTHAAPMPPYGGIPLSDDQVNALAAYVVSLSQGG